MKNLLPENNGDTIEYGMSSCFSIFQSVSSSNQVSLSKNEIESTTTTMVGSNPREDILTSCQATAMIYNDAQKKWMHCAPNGPAKIQLLFAPETRTYRIVGRQIQNHEVVLNHSIIKGIKYNQATSTFHQWRDQSCVYGLNFLSKLDAQEFGTTMIKILESVNGSTSFSSHTNTNVSATLPSSSLNDNNNNNNATMSYKRQNSQPSSLPPTSTTVSIHSTSISSGSDPLQQQQQPPYSLSFHNSQLRPNTNSIHCAPASISNNYCTQNHQSTEDEETNYALISDSYSSCSDNTTNKNNISQVPALNALMSSTGSAPPAPPPPPPLPNGFGSGPSPASASSLGLPTATGNGGASTVRKSSTATSAPPMDLMSEMAAKFAQRRKMIDESEKIDSSNATSNKISLKVTTTATLPPPTAPPSSTSPRIARKNNELHSTTHTSYELEKLKTDILVEIRKDIEKAKQEILNAILESQKRIKK